MLLCFLLFITDIESLYIPLKRVCCHAFKVWYFAEYRSYHLSQFIAFFIDQETKLSRVLFFSFLILYLEVLLLSFIYDAFTLVLISPCFKGFFVFFNDPSAGSPTETLLRLLLPLDKEI